MLVFFSLKEAIWLFFVLMKLKTKKKAKIKIYFYKFFIVQKINYLERNYIVSYFFKSNQFFILKLFEQICLFVQNFDVQSTYSRTVGYFINKFNI